MRCLVLGCAAALLLGGCSSHAVRNPNVARAHLEAVCHNGHWADTTYGSLMDDRPRPGEYHRKPDYGTPPPVPGPDSERVNAKCGRVTPYPHEKPVISITIEGDDS